MSIFQCLRTLVAKPNRLGNRLFLADVTMPKYGFMPDKLVTDDLRSYGAAASSLLGSQNAMSAADGATIEPRIRISQPDDENARCKGSRAWDPRKDFSQCMQQPTTLSTSNAISPQQERRAFRASAMNMWRGAFAVAENMRDAGLSRSSFDNVTTPGRPNRGKRVHRGGSWSAQHPLAARDHAEFGGIHCRDEKATQDH